MSARVKRANAAERQAEACFSFRRLCLFKVFFLCVCFFCCVFCSENSIWERKHVSRLPNQVPSLPGSRVVHSIMEECCMLACFTHIQPKWEINISDSGCFRRCAADQKNPPSSPSPHLPAPTTTPPLPPPLPSPFRCLTEPCHPYQDFNSLATLLGTSCKYQPPYESGQIVYIATYTYCIYIFVYKRGL